MESSNYMHLSKAASCAATGQPARTSVTMRGWPPLSQSSAKSRRTEHVLVVLRIHARGHDGAIVPTAHVQFVLAQRIGGQLPRQLDLVVDGAILQSAWLSATPCGSQS